jgi:DNA-binding NarL/FixJ family response regulator
LLGAAEAAGAGAGAEIMGVALPYWAQAKKLALEALGPSKFETEFTAGNQMSRDAAVRLALGEPNQDEVEAGADAASGSLAKREVEVAQLIAEGLSNKRIGAKLFISEATVATHVRNIMNKLGCNSRAQIAGWMVSQQR